MPTTEIDPNDLAAAVAAFPADSPVFMVNMLRFHDQARYAADSSFAPCTGQEAYLTRYLPAFNEVVTPLGRSDLAFAGSVVARVLRPAEEIWNAVGVARYPNIDTFRRVLEDPGYQEHAEPHRAAALADWRLYATVKLG